MRVVEWWCRGKPKYLGRKVIMSDDSVVSMKKADLIRMMVEAEHENIKKSTRDLLGRAMNLYREADENFTLLLSIVEKLADSGSVDCQQVLAQFHTDYAEAFSA